MDDEPQRLKTFLILSTIGYQAILQPKLAHPVLKGSNYISLLTSVI